MSNTDQDIIAVLLKSIFDKSLISEMTYRDSLNKLYTFDSAPGTSCSGFQQNVKGECLADGHTKN